MRIRARETHYLRKWAVPARHTFLSWRHKFFLAT
jgi:hypothetical protein